MFVFGVLIFLIVCLQADKYPSFKDYTTSFNKVYDKEEYIKRQIIYNQRIKSFAQITKYEAGVNQFTDQSAQQIQSLKGLKPIDHEVSSIFTITGRKLGAPTSKDWRDYSVVTSVKNQGSCGSCWTFAGAGYSQSKLLIENKVNSTIDLSQQYLLQCTLGSTCQGGSLDRVFDTIVKGVALQNDYPYTPYSYYSGICSAKTLINVGEKPLNYYNLSDSEIIQFLQIGPVAISISSFNWESYASGIFSCPSNSSIDHAVLLVGYTQQYWIIKNQWGTAWGEKGYIRISRNSKENCKIGTSVYLINGQSKYKGDSISHQYRSLYSMILAIFIIVGIS